MIRAARTTLTLVFLLAVLLAGGLYGWTRLTAPLPKAEDAPVCEDTRIEAGSKVYPAQVTVSVFNASSRNGLAGRTIDLLKDAGFGSASEGNAPKGTNVEHAQIWTDTPDSPDVRLVRSYLGKRKTVVVPGERLGLGVVVVVGESFDKLAKGKPSTTAASAASICSPLGSSD